MKHFFIISRNEDESRRELIRRLTQYIQQKGGVCSCAHNPEDGRPGEIAVPEGTQCILTVGGDGTLIRAAQNTFGSNIPLLGVNCGHL